jgi:molecular chaperone DnaK
MLISDARQALKEEAPLERLRSLTAELQGMYQSLVAAVQGTRSTQAGPSSEDAGDDDVIDAEFTAG